MPNVKIYIEEAVLAPCQSALVQSLGALRALLCRTLDVDNSACQLAILPVQGLVDQAPVNVELAILPKADRTREKLEALAQAIRARIGATTGTSVAVRISQLDPVTYVALK